MKRQNQLNIKRGLLSKLVLLVALFLGSSNAWAQKELPYSYGFENNNLATEGWTIIDAISNTSIQKKGAYGVQVRTGDYSFRFNCGYNQTEYLVSPLLTSSPKGTDFSFYYMNATSYSKETFYVGYSTSEGAGEPQVSSFTWLPDALVPAASMSEFQKYDVTFNNTNIKYVAIKHVSANSHNVFIDDITISEAETYKRPKNLSVSSFDSSSATLTWDNGSDETAWEIAYSTKEDFDPKTEGIKIPVTENPYTLTGLIDGVTYYAYVRSNYGGNYSEFSNKISFIQTINLLLNDDSSTNTYVPVPNYTYYASIGSQMVIPAAKLTTIQNRNINKIIFYAKESSIDWTDATFDVYLNEVETTTYASSSPSLKEWGTRVKENAVFNVIDGELTINLDQPFPYTSGNLLIGIQRISATTSSVTSTWYGVTEETDYTSVYYSKYGPTSTQYNNPVKFSPKVTLETGTSTIPVTLGSNGYTTFACPRPLDLTALPDELKAYRAEVSAEEGKVRFREINQKVAANTGILLASTDNETYTYNIPVADSGDPVDGNAFLVNSTGGTFLADDGYTYFGFKKNSDPITFATFDPSTVAIPTNKAYLKVKTSELPTEARQLVAVFDDGETTSLREIRNEELGIKNAVFFNLNGQRVAQPTKGLYIVNGKKVLVP